MAELQHHHPNDGSFYPNCKRCKLNIAAPQLLEACKFALSHATCQDEKDKLIAAIAVAEGKV
jgi:hypothetical protein